MCLNVNVNCPKLFLIFFELFCTQKNIEIQYWILIKVLLPYILGPEEILFVYSSREYEFLKKGKLMLTH